MAGRDYAVFPASHREAPRGASVLGDVGRDETIEVSIYLKPRDRDAPAGANRAVLAARRTELHRDDIRLIRQFAAEHDLTVIAVEPARRLVRLSGPAAAIGAAFRTRLQHYHDGTRRFRGVTGALSLPEDLQPIVESVLGLDTRPAASPRIVRATGAAQGYLPNEVGALYGFPGNADGSGECI
ncbi:MAG: protease pro-enzyme activation domain-containing protein, partial [Acetobacteraceae bacterium]